MPNLAIYWLTREAMQVSVLEAVMDTAFCQRVVQFMLVIIDP